MPVQIAALTLMCLPMMVGTGRSVPTVSQCIVTIAMYKVKASANGRLQASARTKSVLDNQARSRGSTLQAVFNLCD